MSSEESEKLEFNQYQNPDKATFIIYADLEQKRLMEVKIILQIHLQQN